MLQFRGSVVTSDAREHIDEAIRSGERVDAKLAAPSGVLGIYITAWATPEDVVEFREDIYQRDGFGPDTADTPPATLPQVQRQPDPRAVSVRSPVLEPMNDDE